MTTTTTVFFATNRAVEQGDGTRPEHYSGELGDPSRPGQLTFGMARVEGTDLDALASGRLAEIQKARPDAFGREVEADLAQSGRNLLVFVHGFANGFTDSIARAAFLREYFAASGQGGADCSVVGFSWPSRGVVVEGEDIPAGALTFVVSLALAALTGRVVSPFAGAYREDQEMALGSAGAIVSFLERLRPICEAVRARGGRATLLAHSMGNLALKGALDRWNGMGSVPDTPIFDEVLSVAADTDWVEGRTGPAWLRSCSQIGDRVSLYHSNSDDILSVSKRVNGGVRRLGFDGPVDMGERATYPAGRWRFVDCSAFADTGPNRELDFSHQYYRRCTPVRDDIARTLAGKGRSGRTVL